MISQYETFIEKDNKLYFNNKVQQKLKKFFNKVAIQQGISVEQLVYKKIIAIGYDNEQKHYAERCVNSTLLQLDTQTGLFYIVNEPEMKKHCWISIINTNKKQLEIIHTAIYYIPSIQIEKYKQDYSNFNGKTMVFYEQHKKEFDEKSTNNNQQNNINSHNNQQINNNQLNNINIINDSKPQPQTISEQQAVDIQQRLQNGENITAEEEAKLIEYVNELSLKEQNKQGHDNQQKNQQINNNINIINDSKPQYQTISEQATDIQIRLMTGEKVTEEEKGKLIEYLSALSLKEQNKHRHNNDKSI